MSKPRVPFFLRAHIVCVISLHHIPRCNPRFPLVVARRFCCFFLRVIADGGSIVQVATILHEHEKAGDPVYSAAEEGEEKLNAENHDEPSAKVRFGETQHADQGRSTSQGMTRVSLVVIEFRIHFERHRGGLGSCFAMVRAGLALLSGVRAIEFPTRGQECSVICLVRVVAD